MRWISSLSSMCIVLAILLCTSGCSAWKTQNSASQYDHSVELFVLAAASLADAMKELTPMYESAHPGQKLVVSYGSSGTLQKQIEQGAPADLFMSAAAKQMDDLVWKGVIDSNHTADFLRNKLVLVIPKNTRDEIKSFEDLQNPTVEKIAIGHPESVPAGIYAKQSFMHFGIWEILQPKFVFAKDVRQVLSYVDTANVDAGIAYMTDIAAFQNVKIAAIADEKSHSPIVYQFGVTKNSPRSEEAQNLLDWFRGEEAAAVFAKRGFDLVVKK
ncbi:molybdate ABC transporter substrate-binding protein [Ammoniphilus sp. YIM 78166]|uniref:molybdate ABC transporter substrate-binding protein n=1 Tax=Ammoniphilus sp. YIM 78166 TaxID=1644106 RepID=UPI001431FC4C|nr:molybdate ABC transporter substrate-binding protein [Ammoniphilus sp. YIM 78166]